MSPKMSKTQEFALNCQKSLIFFVENALKATPSSQQLELLNAVQSAVDGKKSRFITVRSSHRHGQKYCSKLDLLMVWSYAT